MKSERVKDILSILQKFVAVESIGVSAMRGQGPGVLKASQEYVGRIELNKLQIITSEADYIIWLNQHTEALLDILPIRNRPWGAARKALNLFMRACLYNKYISRKFRLEKVEKWMEIPLDSLIAKGLRESKPEVNLPVWQGLKHLRLDQNRIYQNAAMSLAEDIKINRVHLDVILWLKYRERNLAGEDRWNTMQKH